MDRKVEQILTWFPLLATDKDFAITSPATRQYNCIAWALGSKSMWAWPAEPDARESDMLWDNSIGYDESIETFVSFFQNIGFTKSEDQSIESGDEIVALYEKDGLCTHATRLLPTGIWTSKLGPYHDIQHGAPSSLEGTIYGKVYCYMKKKRVDE